MYTEANLAYGIKNFRYDVLFFEREKIKFCAIFSCFARDFPGRLAIIVH